MSKKRVKLILWAIICLIVLVGVWLTVRGMGDILYYFRTGADPAAALNIVPNVPPDLKVELTWMPDDPDTGRELEPFTREQIEFAYIRAWLQWNLSYRKGEPHGLKTYFIGPALEAVREGVFDADARALKINQSDTKHALQLHFYSADGSIVSFTDHNALVAQAIRDANGQEIYADETTADYDVVMFLEDGNWRVRHWVRRQVADHADEVAIGAKASSVGIVGRDGANLIVDGQSFQINGINYYPQETPWLEFWPNYDPQQIDQDLTLIRSLGLNAIRVFVPFEQFGGADVDPSMLENLGDFLDRADLHDLKVIVTLFDLRSSYDPLFWPHADRHLETILTTFAEHPTILAWDLKNEPDLDYAVHGPQTVKAWLEHTSKLARRYDPNHLLTIGWSSPEVATTLADRVDFVSYHYYRPTEDLPEHVAALRATIPNKPLLLTEFGLPTWNSVFPNGHTEAEQARYYADILAYLRQNNMAGHLAWTLYDFPRVPTSLFGRLPWRTGPQKHLGIVRTDGTAKPSAVLLTANADLTVVGISPWSRFLKPFWLGVLVFLVGLVVLGFVYRRRRQLRRSASGNLGERI